MDTHIINPGVSKGIRIPIPGVLKWMNSISMGVINILSIDEPQMDTYTLLLIQTSSKWIQIFLIQKPPKNAQK